MISSICSIHPPLGSMDMLSQIEINILKNTAESDLYQLFRNCLLAVLNTGSQIDDPRKLFDRYKDFEANLVRTERGIRLELINPPKNVFVDGVLAELIRKNLFAVLRDILFVKGIMSDYSRFMSNGLSTSTPSILTDVIFFILRNAKALHANTDPNIVVCWGGHSIDKEEFQYGRDVGYELGLRHLDICTGCGPGAMEAPMRGAAVGHAQQANKNGRFLGITEISIIAAEPPNPLVNELIIMPDIEKRLEAFVRLGHGIIIFPGGVGTAEEFLYILGILMEPENQDNELPLILTGPKSSMDYFQTLNHFVEKSLGKEAQKLYEIIIDDPILVAQKMAQAMPKVKANRLSFGDSYCFNWRLKIRSDFQTPFIPTHENMADLDLHFDQPKQLLAASLRKAFSGIVAGNVKDFGLKMVQEKGPFKLQGDAELAQLIDNLLSDFVQQQRMKLPGSKYIPCYQIEL